MDAVRLKSSLVSNNQQPTTNNNNNNNNKKEFARRKDTGRTLLTKQDFRRFMSL